MADKPPLEWLAARGVIAAGVAAELAAPLEAIHKKLAATVERLDKHVAHARGPEPLPWQTVGEIRERVADVFLEAGRARPLAASLAILAAPAERRLADLNDVVERALVLARHRFDADSDALLDLATLPNVTVDAGRLSQAIALLLVHAAEAAAPAGTVVVHTEARPAHLVVRITAPPTAVADKAPASPAVRAAGETQCCASV